MDRICLMLKTYAADQPYVTQLVESFHRFNRDSLPLYIVCPGKDLEGFQNHASETVSLVAEEEIPVHYAADSLSESHPTGILNAGVAKLGFWELGLCKNYFAVDSETEFLRPFGASDFLDSRGNPYLIVTNPGDVSADPFYFGRYGTDVSDAADVILRTLKVKDSPTIYSLAGQVMNADILASLKESILDPDGMTYLDLMRLALYEWFWYAAWAHSQTSVPVTPRPELVRVIHHQGEHLGLHDRGIRKSDLARGYLGLLINSNWARQYGMVDFDNPPREKYLSQGAWADWVSSTRAL